jgi:glycosyltransferase involved in cell wall biosynthesis
MKISFIIPSRNNLTYLKWSVESIIQNRGSHQIQICVADDASSDGTLEWLTNNEIPSSSDVRLDWIRHDGPDRLGHTILYDKLIKEVAIHDLCIIYHADMYLCPFALDEIERNMFNMVYSDRALGGIEFMPKFKTITSLTRIEPPLHPEGPEKILKMFGTEPDNFKELDLIAEVQNLRSKNLDNTNGVFAPWAFWKSDFNEIGGHDPLFAPQSKEDSDIFNRFKLNNIEFIQTWKGFVYHLTCRGNRRNTNDGAPDIHTDNPEWLFHNNVSSRNFIRKWGHYVAHDKFLNPIILPKFDIGIVFMHGCDFIDITEPWCDNLYVNSIYNSPDSVVESYKSKEQQFTKYDLNSRIKYYESLSAKDIINELKGKNDIVVFINDKFLSYNNKQEFINLLNLIQQHCWQLSIYENGNEAGFYDLTDAQQLNIEVKMHVNKITDYTRELIILKN